VSIKDPRELEKSGHKMLVLKVGSFKEELNRATINHNKINL
jgi:hypothetical protein